ncbi:hypothetical protein HPP05_11045 [Corallococcus exiguus]|uniref:hypothetical protein n=1 Tax=Corallococcus exiguus TaxID=83462 RepID=UPI00149477A1|nr:hypothetical protein [Corallococcus exiguus]NPC70281.1 hypothetical protein [Corallococcus exiguus]
MRGFFGTVLLAGLLAACGGSEPESESDARGVQEASCLSECQAEYHQCMVENAGNGPGKVLCGYALNACKANCPPGVAPAAEHVSQAEASIVIPDCTVFEGYACAPPRARKSCYHNQSGQQTPGLCICSAAGIWSCG